MIESTDNLIMQKIAAALDITNKESNFSVKRIAAELDITNKESNFNGVLKTKKYSFETKCRYKNFQMFQDGALNDSCTALISIAAASVNTIVKS